MQEQLVEIINSKDLKDITIDLVEKVLDSEITNEVLKEIPILKSLVAVRNIYTSYTDRIFIKKAMNVILELGDISIEERAELTKELNDKDTSGAERILMAIDRLETIEKSKVFGRLCKLKALNRVNKNEFLRLTKLIQDAYPDDLWLIHNFKIGEPKVISEYDYTPIIILGLIYQEPSEQMPIESKHQYSEYDPEFKGGEITFNYYLSDLGILLFEKFEFLFPKIDKY